MSLDATFEEANIPHGALLLLVGQTFSWDLNRKGSNITLLNNKLTANKKQETSFETVLANIFFENGSHYWEITVDTFIDMEDIYIGICKKNVNLYT